MINWEEWLDNLAVGGYEAVAVTKIRGRSNASAVGVMWDGEVFHLRIFEGSDSYEALQRGTNLGLCFYPEEQLTDIVTAALKGYGSVISEFPSTAYSILDKVTVLRRSPGAFMVTIINRYIEETEDDVGTTKILMLKALPVTGSVRKSFKPVKMAGHPILVSASACTRVMYLASKGDLKSADPWIEKTKRTLEGNETTPEAELILSVLEKLR